MDKNSVKLNDVTVWFSDFGLAEDFIKQRRRMYGEKDRLCKCALTGSPFLITDDIYLVICNYVLFPNCVVLKSEVSRIGYLAAAKKLQKNYKLAKKAMDKWGHWFNLESR